MSGWQLGLVLFGVWLAGVGCGLVLVWAYARHVYRHKVNELLRPGQQLTTTGQVAPPPPREHP